MKLGVCAKMEQAELAYQAGFDYVEYAIDTLMPDEDDRGFQARLNQLLDNPLPIEVFNVFVPPRLKLVGPDVSWDEIERYLERVIARVKQVRGEVIVFGSGGARNIPPGYEQARAEEQIIHFLHKVADLAEPLDIVIAIEPLYKKACNFIHTVPEAAAIAKQVNRPSIQVLADFFHMMEEDDPLDSLYHHREQLRHIHVSDHYKPPGTVLNQPYPFSDFVKQFHRSGYDGRVSIECVWDDFAAQIDPAREVVAEHFGKRFGK